MVQIDTLLGNMFICPLVIDLDDSLSLTAFSFAGGIRYGEDMHQ